MKKTTAHRERMVVEPDLGDRYSQFCILDPEGEAESSRAAFELGTHSPWVDRLLQSLGHKTIMANAGKVALIYRNERKHDRKDARSLAELGQFKPILLHSHGRRLRIGSPMAYPWRGPGATARRIRMSRVPVNRSLPPMSRLPSGATTVRPVGAA